MGQNMSWFIWAIFSVVTTAVANLLQRVIMRDKDSDAFGTAIIFQFSIALLTGMFAIWNGFVLPPIGKYFWNFLASTLLWGLGSLSLFKAYQTLGSSKIAIISSLGTVVTIVSSIVFLGESFNTPKIIGTLLIITSIFFVTEKKGKFSFTKGTSYALITTLFYGLAVTNDAFILKTYDAVSYTSVISFLPGILLLALRPRAIASFQRLRNVIFMKKMFLLTIFYSAQAVAYYLALHLGANASQLAPIYKTNIILTVLLAIVFLKEKERIPLKLFSAVLVTVGVLLIK